MPDPTPRREFGPRALEATALHYAARDLSPEEAAAFEAQLAEDQTARDALAEAVRLSAAALGQEPPAPDRSFRALIRDRLRPLAGWCPGWLTRRAYRGHPLAWTGLGAWVVAAVAVVGLNLAGSAGTHPANRHAGSEVAPEIAPFPHLPPGSEAAAVDVLPPVRAEAAHVASADAAAAACGTEDATRKAAEIWAELSTAGTMEKAVEDETRWRQRLKDLNMGGHGTASRPAAVGIDSRDP